MSPNLTMGWALGATFTLGLILYMAACTAVVGDDELATSWHLTVLGQIQRISFGDLRNIWTWIVPSVMAAVTIGISQLALIFLG